MFPLSKKRKVLKRRVSPQTTPDLDSHASMRTRFTDRSQHLYQKTQTPTVPTQLVSSMQEPFLREAEYCGQIHASRARTLKINRMRGKYTKSIKKKAFAFGQKDRHFRFRQVKFWMRMMCPYPPAPYKGGLEWQKKNVFPLFLTFSFFYFPLFVFYVGIVVQISVPWLFNAHATYVFARTLVRGLVWQYFSTCFLFAYRKCPRLCCWFRFLCCSFA